MNKAVIVGINAYPGCPLHGCVNDATNMKGYIKEKFGFTDDQIRLITDGAATTANILAQLNWLVDGASPGDRLLFHYSGHGATVYTGNPEKPSGISNCICPVDFNWARQYMIIDEQFVQIFSKLPTGVIFNWVSDSCHSATLDRDMAEPPKLSFFQKIWAKIAFWKKTIKPSSPRAYPVPAHIHATIQQAKADGHQVRSIVNGMLDVGFVAGCEFNQTSADTEDPNGTPCGALTYYLIRDMRAMPQLSSVADIVSRVRQDLQRDGYQQSPQAEGSRISRPFLNA